MERWEVYAKLTFSQVFMKEQADLKFIFTELDDGVLGRGSIPMDGSVSFSEDFEFDFGSDTSVLQDKYDFESVAVHEVGHASGIAHTPQIEGTEVVSVMHPKSAPPGEHDVICTL
ncbi:metalloendoproteinase 1-like [Papaver somniferum]|uniref:metalloendoproteinase 1-like n=1 Tax=Papaver somniferum TaxID=3469 RepID=UPI000E704097|nr:metalloendoproteinase 1-like [Papaver somniferum]